MIPFMYAIMCLTGLHPKDKCPTKTPVSGYQLNHIWNPTNPYLADKYREGYWTKSNDKVTPDFTSLRGRKLRIGAVLDPPFSEFIKDDKGNITFKGTATLIISTLREALGFDYQMIEAKKVGIFNETGDGKWSGMLGMLEQGEIDFSINFLSILAIRAKYFNFSLPFGEERWVVMMTRPKETTDGDGLVAPFQTVVWWCLLFALLTMGPLAYVMVKLKNRACRSIPHLNVPYSFGSCVWFVYGALMKQGSVLKPIADSSRILFATWWIFVTILTAFYTANLTAYLTLSKIPIPYDDLTRVGYGDKWVMQVGDTLEQIMRLQETQNDTAKGVFYYGLRGSMKLVPHPEFYKLRWRYNEKYETTAVNVTAMKDLVKKRAFVMLEEQSRVERVIYRDFRRMSFLKEKLSLRCNFIMSRHAILRSPYGFAYRNATLRDIFAPVVNKLTIGGLFNYWRRWELPVTDPCNEHSAFRERQLRNGDLMTTYILCLIGYSLGFSSFVCEFIHKWLTNRKIKTQLVPVDKAGLSFYKGNLTVPAGAPTYFDTEKFLKNINGRNYIVMKTADGRTRLVPKSDGMQALQPVYQPPPLISFGYMS